MIGFFLEPFRTLFRFRRLLLESTISEVRKRNAGSVLGTAWLAVSPLVFLGIYSLVYWFIFRVRPQNMTPQRYILHVLCGIVPFMAISEGISAGIPSLESNRSILKNTVFPIELIPVKVVLSTIPTQIFGLLLLFIGSVLVGGISIQAFWVPVFLALQLMFTFGVAWALSLVGLVFRDIRNIVTYLIMICMILSPIAYTADMIPPTLRFLSWLNPFAYFVISYQQVMVWGKAPPLETLALLVGVSVTSFLASHFFFSRLKSVIAHYA